MNLPISPLRALPDIERLRLAYLRVPALWRRFSFERALAEPVVKHALALTAESLARKDEAEIPTPPTRRWRR